MKTTIIQYNYSMLLGLLSGIFWALDTILLGKSLEFSKLATDSIIFILLIAGLHDFISGLWVLFSIVITKNTRMLLKSLHNKDCWVICVAALAGGPVGMSAYLLSIKFTGAGTASILSTIYPAIGAFFAYLILKERLGFCGKIGLVIIIASTSLLSLSDLTMSDVNFIGVIFGLICAVGWGAESTICSLALKNDLQYSVALLLRQLTSAFIYFIILFIVNLNDMVVVNLIKTIPLHFYLKLLGIAALGASSYLLYYRTIGKLGAIKAMGLNISYSAWTILLGCIFGVDISFFILMLSVTIISGSLLTNWTSEK